MTAGGKSSYTRAGVEAAVRLASSSKSHPPPITKWRKIESQYKDMLQKKGGSKLVQLDNYCDSLRDKLQSSPTPCINKEELLQVIDWKFTKGKARYALLNHLKSNTPDSVLQHSTTAFQEAKEQNIRQAIQSFCHLKGVGPATASALLSLYKPEFFAFMDDEVIECLYEKKRGYTLSIYVKVNEECLALAQLLNQEEEGEEEWSPWRVGRVLWTAARIAACSPKEDDLTLHLMEKNASVSAIKESDDRNKRKSTKQPKKVSNANDAKTSKRTRKVPPRNAKRQRK